MTPVKPATEATADVGAGSSTQLARSEAASPLERTNVLETSVLMAMTVEPADGFKASMAA